MKVTFYGTRGSCPTPGADTLKYGGNTACVLVDSGDGRQLIIDAGTGIRVLGEEFIQHHEDVYLLLSHNHHDHIQGFPFFKPLYQAGRKIFIYPAETEPHQPRAVIEQVNGSYFPLEEHELKADFEFKHPVWDNQPININGFNVYRRGINHPNGGAAYIIEYGNKRVAYITDNELNPPGPQTTTPFEWKEFVLGVDLVIHDGQYIEKDMPLKLGWGHSLISEVVDLANCAKIAKLAIYSHDPERTDDELDAWQAKIDAMGLDSELFFSKEGQVVEL